MRYLLLLLTLLTIFILSNKSRGDDLVSLDEFNQQHVNWEMEQIEFLNTPEEQIEIDKEELRCLTMNIYFEAAIEPYAGKLAVATVTTNRVMSEKYPNSYCDVVWQIKRHPTTGKKVPQFSWTLDGKPDRPWSYNSKSWQISLKLATEVLLYGKRSGIIGTDVYNYHASYVNPYWATQMNMVAQIGNHLFYVN